VQTDVLLAISGAVFAAALAVTAGWNGRRSLAQLAFACGIALLAVESIFATLAASVAAPDRVLYWQNWRLVSTSLLPGLWIFFSSSYARGNDRERWRRWSVAWGASILCPFLLALCCCGKLATSLHRPSPALPWLIDLGGPGLCLSFVSLITAVVVLANLERTFRASAGKMRVRIKYIILALALLFGVRIYSGTQELLFSGTTVALQTLNSEALLVACLTILPTLWRQRHPNIKVYPSAFVLHQSLTAIAAGVYALVMVGLVKLATLVGGQKAFALQVFLVLLAIALLSALLFSEGVRSHLRRFVNRNFTRPQYDYRTVWRTFTECTVRQVEQQELGQAILRFLSELFQTLSVTLWVVDDRKENLVFAGSTSLSKSEAELLKPVTGEAQLLVSGLKEAGEPIDVERATGDWASILHRLHPREDGKTQGRICAPLIARGEVLGVLTLGSRIGGVPYSFQDLDLLKSVSDQAGASLLNLRLSQKVTQAKQLEAFQLMSAFFVHDLKNTASTLSLMLQNLPAHFEEPDFQEDACRAISKIVQHINERISRLSLLRQELALQAVETDLNQLVSDTLSGIEHPTRAELVKDLRPLPHVRIDPAQIRSVITNLVLNARDALGLKGGRIHVETAQQDGWVMLGVADTGCGMTHDFIQRLLFRPFQTTKRNGIGIGMFQCKRIVEAHHGKIEVESEPGKGTAFRILLPTLQLAQ
jgi:putative PEP-CTERM system histidine kinase